MNSRSIRLPTGVRDFLPRAARRRRSIADRLLRIFESWGYQRIITPLFECADVLERGLGQDAQSAAIRFIEPTSGEIVALRPDITPQIARVAATRLRDVGGPVRLCYEGAVARMGSGARGQREVMQAGVELLDAGGSAADAELLGLAAAALASAEVSERSLDLGHVALTEHALSGVDEQLRETLAACLLRKDRQGVARASTGLPKKQRQVLEALPTLFGDPRTTLRRARALPLPAPVRRSLDELEESLALAKSTASAGSELLAQMTLDLGELRGFEYYTGLRISGFVKGAGAPVLRGGRYNALVERYGRKAFATGFAVDIESIAQVESAASTGPSSARSGLLVACDDAHRKLAAQVAASLRLEGLPVALDCGKRRSGSALLRYANRVDLSTVLLLNDAGFQLLREGHAALPLSQASVKRARKDPLSLIARIFPDSQTATATKS